MTRSKPAFASDTQNSANGSAMSLALRQLQAILSGPVFWIVIGAAVLLAAMAGPYYTLERLSFPERLVYWATTITLSSILMTFVSILAYRLTEAFQTNWVLVSVLAGLSGILPVVGTLYLAEWFATGFSEGWPGRPGFWPLFYSVAPAVIAMTLIVNALFHYLRPGREAEPAETGEAQQAQPLTLLQSKLPLHLGREIVCVQAQDHYVEVTTPKGRAMVLMRLSDAVQDLEPIGGMQVHRSWWVNLVHIVRMEKGPSGPDLILTSGERIPVGRSYRKALREAMRTGS